MKFVSKLFSLYRGVLYTVIVLYLLVAIAPMLFGIQPYMVVSGSMEPTIHTGALAYMDKNDVDVSENDIIAFTEGNTEKITVIHRIIKDNGDGTYITKGDANTDEDFAPITQDQIQGTIVFNVPKLGYVTNYLQSTKGIIAAVVLILIALVSSFITDSNEAQKIDIDESDDNKNNTESEIQNEETKKQS